MTTVGISSVAFLNSEMFLVFVISEDVNCAKDVSFVKAFPCMFWRRQDEINT